VTDEAVTPAIVKFAATIVAGFIASLKVALIVAFVAMPVALAAGIVEATVGGVVSAVAPVVKLQVTAAAKAFPSASLAPVVIVAVYRVLAAKLAVGVKVATKLSAT
jgi:ABC-type dipeptide/oligopeptide/nickel transport system permease subunit